MAVAKEIEGQGGASKLKSTEINEMEVRLTLALLPPGARFNQNGDPVEIRPSKLNDPSTKA